MFESGLRGGRRTLFSFRRPDLNDFAAFRPAGFECSLKPFRRRFALRQSGRHGLRRWADLDRSIAFALGLRSLVGHVDDRACVVMHGADHHRLKKTDSSCLHGMACSEEAAGTL